MTSFRARWRLARLRTRADEGFSLIESVVALVVISFVLTALAASIIMGVRASMISRQNQQAADFMTQALEKARQLDFASLGHASADLSGDSRVTSCGPDKCFDPGTGSEKLYITNGAAYSTTNSHTKTVVGNHVNFSVSTYVTQVAGSDPSKLRRVTVVASWKALGLTRSRSISSLVTLAQRGLPLPRYTFTTATPSVTVNPGAQVVYLLRLLNQGAPDRWNLSLSGTASTWSWSLYQDVDNDGFFDSTVDTLLTDTNGDGKIDTGRLDPTTNFSILAVYNSDDTDATGSKTLTVTATSVGQPTATARALNLVTTLTTGSVGPTSTPTSTPTGTATPTATPTSTPTGTSTTTAAPVADCTWNSAVPSVVKPASTGAGTAYTATTYSLHNGTAGSTADTVAQSVSSMNLSAAGTHALAAMSTDINSLPGRTVNTTSVTTDVAALALTDPRQFLNWKVSTTTKSVSIGGTAVLKLWVGPTSGSLTNAQLRVVAYKGVPGSGATSIGSWTGTVNTSCAGWQQFYLSIPLTTSSVAKNSEYGVRVVNTGTTQLRFAYDGVASPASGTNGYDGYFGLGVR